MKPPARPACQPCSFITRSASTAIPGGLTAEQQIARDLEDRPVVNSKYLPPLIQHVGLCEDTVVRYLVQVLHAVVACQVLVEHQRVDQNCRGHPQRLIAVRLLQMLDDCRLRVAAQLCRLPQNSRCVLNAFLQDVDRPLDGVLRRSRVDDERSQVPDAAAR